MVTAGEVGFNKNIVHGGYLNSLMICSWTGVNGSIRLMVRAPRNLGHINNHLYNLQVYPWQLLMN